MVKCGFLFPMAEERSEESVTSTKDLKKKAEHELSGCVGGPCCVRA